MTAPDAPRMKRLCDICGGYDDHPRHVQQVPPDYPDAVPDAAFLDSLGEVSARAVAELMDPTTVVRHMDCCASRGCDLCQATQATHEGLTGPDLIEHLQSGAVDGMGTESPITPSTDTTPDPANTLQEI